MREEKEALDSLLLATTGLRPVETRPLVLWCRRVAEGWGVVCATYSAIPPVGAVVELDVEGKRTWKVEAVIYQPTPGAARVLVRLKFMREGWFSEDSAERAPVGPGLEQRLADALERMVKDDGITARIDALQVLRAAGRME